MLRLTPPTRRPALRNTSRRRITIARARRRSACGAASWPRQFGPDRARSTKDAFERLCDNMHPATGKQLTPRMNDNRRVGEDFVFSLPKDVGACDHAAAAGASGTPCWRWSAGGSIRCMGMIEADVRDAGAARTGPSRTAPGDGLAWAGFLHTTGPAGATASRPIRIRTGTCSPSTPRTTRSRRTHQGGGVRQHLPRPAVLRGRVLLAGGRRISHGWACRSSGGPTASGAWPGCNRWAPPSPSGPTKSRTRPGGSTSPMPGRKAELGAKTRSKKQKELTPAELREAWHAQLTDGDRDALARGRSAGACGIGREVTARRSGGLRHRPLQRKALGLPRAGTEAGGVALRAGQRHAGAGRGRAAASGRHHRRDRRQA